MAIIDVIQKKLNVQPDGIPTVVRLSQNENGRELVFDVENCEIPAGSTVTISGTKPDGNVYSLVGSITDNTVTFAEDIQMTAVGGQWDAKVVIVNGGNTVATGRVRMIIDPDTVDPEAVPSSSQLEGLVAQAEAYAEIAQAAAEKATTDYMSVHFIPLHVAVEGGTVKSDGVGSCVLIQCNGKNYLVDAFTDYQMQNYGYPYLQSLGVSIIDCLFITHYHGDHCGGVSYLLSNVAVNAAVIPPAPDWDDAGFIATGDKTEVQTYYNSITAALTAAGVPYTTATAGTLPLDDDLSVRIGNTDYTPYYAMTTPWPSNYSKERSDLGVYADYNNYSIFYQFVFAGVSALFMGDAGYTAMNTNLAWAEKCELWAIPHHNHQHFVNSDFIDAISPRFTAVQDTWTEYEALYPGTIHPENRKPSKYCMSIGADFYSTLGNAVVYRADASGSAIVAGESEKSGETLLDFVEAGDWVYRTDPSDSLFVKLPNGLMIQWGSTSTFTVTANTYKDVDIAYPEQFVGTWTYPLISMRSDSSSPDLALINPCIYTRTVNGMKVRVFSGAISASRQPYVTWMTIGRWK